MREYRGEGEALHARIGALEDEIAEQRARAERLVADRQPTRSVGLQRVALAVLVIALPLAVWSGAKAADRILRVGPVTWPARVARSTDPRVQPGDPCQVRAVFRRRTTAITGARVTIQCGEATLYDREPPCSLAPDGLRAVLSCRDGARLVLDTRRETATLRPDSGGAVELGVTARSSLLSKPVPVYVAPGVQ